MSKLCKLCGSEAYSKYNISWIKPTSIFECTQCGFHFLDAFDDEFHTDDTQDNSITLSKDDEIYIRNKLQGNADRFLWQINVLKEIVPQTSASVLDVGAGGGLFLHLAEKSGFRVFGSEPNGIRRQFARNEYGLVLNQELVESSFWDRYAGSFDAITIWDVIEHVNDPRSLLARCRDLLRPGGIILIDTPQRGSIFYRSSELIYKLSSGKHPFLLKTMYSPDTFGHKQIFRTSEMKELLNSLQLDTVILRKFHELSFPHDFYLKRLLRNDIAVKIALPFARALIAVLPVKNKMMVVARARTKEGRSDVDQA